MRPDDTDMSASKFGELLSGSMLDVYVGSDRRHWCLHHNLLCHYSGYFQNPSPLNGEPVKFRDGQVELPDEDPDAFEVLIKWLYQGTIEDVSTMPPDKKWGYAFTCQKLYLLCEKLGVEPLKNAAIDQFRKGCHEAHLVPGAEEIQPIYERTGPSSPLRKLVSRIVARQIMDPDTHRDATEYQPCFASLPTFAMDVINAIRENSGGILFDDPTEGNSCRYHQHAGDKTCQKSVTFAPSS